ncbi:MAG: hypothetical protein ACRENA_11740 [Vulcanimicrobiaceae bacterium]
MNALVPRAPTSVNVMQSAGEGVAADIRAVRIDPRMVLYIVRVASTTFQLTARLVGIRRSGETLDLGGLAVAPASIGSARLTVPQGCAEECATIQLEIRTHTSLMRLEAPPPVLQRRVISWRFATAAALMLIGFCGALSVLDRPHPAPLAAAPVIPVKPQIISLSVRRDRGSDGDSVLGSYLAVGDGGSFALVGPGGKIVARAPFTRIGTSRLAVPKPYRDTPLFARLTVTRDGKAAFTSVALVSSPRALPARAASKTVPAVSVRDLVAIEGPAFAGGLLNLRIDADLASPHIELQDVSGNTVASRDLAAGTARASIPLPAAAAPQTYYVVLRYVRNGAEETVVRSIVASSRS